MDIDHILQTELQQEDREVLAEDKERWHRLGAGQHLYDWLAYAPGLRIRRKLAMRVNFTNKPEGRGYTETYGQCYGWPGLIFGTSGWGPHSRPLLGSMTISNV